MSKNIPERCKNICRIELGARIDVFPARPQPEEGEEEESIRTTLRTSSDLHPLPDIYYTMSENTSECQT